MKEEFFTKLPMFPGFYGTPLDIQPEENDTIIDSILYDLSDEKYGPISTRECYSTYASFYDKLLNMCWREIEYDYKTPESRSMEQFASVVEYRLSMDVDLDVEFKDLKLWSPREHNFRNDEVDCTAILDPNELLVKVKENYDALIPYCKDRFTSYDGYISFVSNDAAVWVKALEDMCKGIESEEFMSIGSSNLIYALLEFLLWTKNKEFWRDHDYIYDVYSNIAYAVLSDDLITFLTSEEVFNEYKEYRRQYNLLKEELKNDEDLYKLEQAYLEQVTKELYEKFDEIVKNSLDNF
jgi:hypothetical protein